MVNTTPDPPLHAALVQAIVAVLPAQTEGMLSCVRVWSAWSHGTMGEDDFVPVSDDSAMLDDIAQCVATRWQEGGPDDLERLRQGLIEGLGQTLVHESGWPCEPSEFTDSAFSLVSEDPDRLNAMMAPLLAACRAVDAAPKALPSRARPRFRG